MLYRMKCRVVAILIVSVIVFPVLGYASNYEDLEKLASEYGIIFINHAKKIKLINDGLDAKANSFDKDAVRIISETASNWTSEMRNIYSVAFLARKVKKEYNKEALGVTNASLSVALSCLSDSQFGLLSAMIESVKNKQIRSAIIEIRDDLANLKSKLSQIDLK